MLSLRALLTAQQRTRLKELRKSFNPAAVEGRLKEKMVRVQGGIQRIAAAGGDPSSLSAKLQAFPDLIRLGKVNEAEALLDRLLVELELK